MSSLRQQKLLDYLPIYVIHGSEWLKERNKLKFDRFGDSYFEEIASVHELESIFDCMEGKEEIQKDIEAARKLLKSSEMSQPNSEPFLNAKDDEIMLNELEDLKRELGLVRPEFQGKSFLIAIDEKSTFEFGLARALITNLMGIVILGFEKRADFIVVKQTKRKEVAELPFLK